MDPGVLRPCRDILRVISWNVRGCRATDFENFLLDAGNEMGWSILLLQEFTASLDIERFVSSAGHRVFLAAPSEGSRSCCIVIHASIAYKVIPDSFRRRDRGVAVGLHWEGWNLVLISSHLHPGQSRVSYDSSLDDMQDLCDIQYYRRLFTLSTVAGPELLNNPIYRVVGVDANTPVGKPISREEEYIIGEATMGERGWKGKAFLRFCLEEELTVWNTFSKDTLDTFTCYHDLLHLPNQIDYLLSDIPRRAVQDKGVKQSTATRTDHRSPFATIFGRWLQPRRIFKP